ncbi:MAG: carbonic anhydrase [Christensenella sp.]|uniref:beta-class carbonic anhydrase n=1 Tax=Christensenella sp. TaxID=1935934 RepID=UPI002B21DC3A|nr:carbonic anhydrase [Christensenella sp.]MEA5004480.1 carbonic anhydrase [Christensenella sp.]
MSYVEQMLAFNKEFVEKKEYEKFTTTKYPDKKVAVLSCMDTRLTELLPAALDFKNGDVKIIKNAGGVISHPFGSVMRSLLVAVYELGVSEIFVIGHYDCGMQGLHPQDMTSKMLRRGIKQEDIEFIRYCGVDVDQWLKGFDDPEESVRETVRIVSTHPLIPKDVAVSGFLIDPETGRMDVISR